ncbi:hypothetical protein OBO34_11140 [Clostridiales Family XIII bacterium ASD5510]|uniref:Uncharacterized protein n=1 Tax=Hominibacterium faecale TaxID=2839743 RepID=A0A9J6QW63_9FIRM|nr:hypothetical protein [Hominibacterium faecale]MCU7378910.1 hypothetical protein [Hominibacterium faecale]
MKNRIDINWEWITETAKARKSGFLLFLAGIVFLIILLFWDDRTILQVEEPASGPAPETQQEITTANQEQAGKNTKTTCWFWQGDESGVPSKEYLTLCEDQTYVLTIELQGRDPAEVTGKYQQKDRKLRLWRGHKQISGTISKTQVILEEKTYEKTQCGHI